MLGMMGNYFGRESLKFILLFISQEKRGLAFHLSDAKPYFFLCVLPHALADILGRSVSCLLILDREKLLL